MLTLLDAAERIGIAPLSAQRLHRLVYLANAMAPVYDLLTPDGYLLKYKRGPFFPEVQWDIDRVCAQGLAAASNLKTLRDDLGWWFEADYSLTATGMSAVDKALQLSEMAKKASYLREVVRAFAGVIKDEEPPKAADDLVLVDISYDRADAEGPIDFDTASRNLTVLAADAIARRVDKEAASRRQTIHVYFRYLDKVWDREQERARA
ncbi:hypothetical protein IED13_27155 [Bosea sp. SSUT16]|uniref:Uncharacterized protein n=1 Tax=Bosea spartocytisi TaxID=2773451 RepID=A0A927EGA4_9HYPH|nr:hypothetical protein [Bosea spartocytisi]MBD3849394.1 hypothetical protein [Bosea spartocytisi]MCT4475015.1 hypothetical protein [Bosea spartocytisi]